MRLLKVLLGLFVCVVVRDARADAYEWGGLSGRFQVHVVRGGFNEGAGEGGWDEDSARSFASWARRFNQLLPPHARLSLEMDASDDDTTMTLTYSDKKERTRIVGELDFGLALARLARRFHARKLPPVTHPPLYTIQVFASHTLENAERRARALDAAELRPEEQFYYEACLPCSVPETRVLGPGRDGLYRVVAGVYDRRSVARHAGVNLRQKWKIDAFARVL